MVMNKKEFYKTYIPALEMALDNDHISLGFNVQGPEAYIDSGLQIKIDNYIENNEDEFLERIAYYFDAKSHNFPSIQGVSIEEYKSSIVKNMESIKKSIPR